MEVEGAERSRQAFFESHPIDAEHKRVMRMAIAEAVPTELLLELRPE
jgi:hypothetical protein